VAQELGETQEIVLNKILDVWLDKMALVTQLERRKLLGLALTSLLTSQSRYNSHLDYEYTGCPRRNVPDFRRVFLMLKYTDITQNTYIQS